MAGEDSGIGVESGGDAIQAHISDVLIAGNTIQGDVDIGISVASGYQRAQANVTENIRVLDNRIWLVRRELGREHDAQRRRPREHDRRHDRRGVTVQAGNGAGGSRNRVESVRIERNAIAVGSRATGVLVWAGAAGRPPYKNRIATGNRVSGVTIAGNRIALGSGKGSESPAPGAIAIVSGGHWGRSNSVSCVRVTGAGTPVGVQLGSPGNHATLAC